MTTESVFYAYWLAMAIELFYISVLSPLRYDIPYWWGIITGKVDREATEKKTAEFIKKVDAEIISAVDENKKMVSDQLGDWGSILKTGYAPPEMASEKWKALKEMNTKYPLSWQAIVYPTLKFVFLIAGILLSPYWLWFMLYAFISIMQLIIGAKNTGNSVSKFRHYHIFQLIKLAIPIAVLYLYYQTVTL